MRASRPADVHLPGLVVEQDSKFNTGKVHYISGAEIKAVGNSTVSDTDGKFTLVFAGKPIGNVVRVFVAKQGYELVNYEELKKTAVTGRREPLKVVMCKEGQLFERQLEYYVTARDAKLKSLRAKIALLKSDSVKSNAYKMELEKVYNQEINTIGEAIALLNSEMQNVDQEAQALAERFVTVNLDDQSEAYQRAFRAFEGGDIDLAISILDSVDLRERLEANQEIVSKSRSVVAEKQAVRDTAKQQIRKELGLLLDLAGQYQVGQESEKADSLFSLALGLYCHRITITPMVLIDGLHKIRLNYHLHKSIRLRALMKWIYSKPKSTTGNTKIETNE